MLPPSLRQLIKYPEEFLESKYPLRKENKVQQEQFEVHSRKFMLAKNLVLPPEETQRKIAKVHADIDRDLMQRHRTNKLSPVEMQSLGIGDQKSAIIPRQVYRFQEEGYPCAEEHLDKLLIYLELPHEEWKKYYSYNQTIDPDNKEKKTLPLNEAAKNQKNIVDRLLEVANCWNGYVYDPDQKKVYQLPFFFERVDSNVVKIYMRGINNVLFSGTGERMGQYLICTLTNEKKSNAISIQIFVNDSVLNGDCIINAACIWAQTTGKPILSVMLLDRKRKRFQKAEIPRVEIKTLKPNSEPSNQRVNQFIEYVSRKGEPELAARLFKPNTIDEVTKRNLTTRIFMPLTRPREEYEELQTLFTCYGNGENWYSFSRLYSNLSKDPEKLTVFRWRFSDIKNMKVIKAQRLNRFGESLGNEGLVQLKQRQLSIYLTSRDEFGHFVCPLPFNRYKEYQSQKIENPNQAVVLLGTSSILHEGASYLIKEMLVNTNRLKKGLLKNGFLSIDEYLNLDFLTPEQKGYLIDREKSIFYYHKSL